MAKIREDGKIGRDNSVPPCAVSPLGFVGNQSCHRKRRQKDITHTKHYGAFRRPADYLESGLSILSVQ
jgi:hypothetical protein